MDESTWVSAVSRRRRIAVIFFALLMAGGLVLARDYGIPWDEPIMREQLGMPNYLYVQGKAPRPEGESVAAVYGPVYEMALIGMEKALKVKDDRQVYLLHHRVNFLVFCLAVLVFYRLLRRRVGPWPALAGAAFLVLSPRIFADAYFNSKDLTFLCFYIFSLGSLDVFLRRLDWRGAGLHALLCALLIDVRILGALVPVLTVLLSAGVWVAGRRQGRSGLGLLGVVLGFGVLTGALVVLFWPVLWDSPYTFVRSFQVMSKFSWPGPCLYLGEQVPAQNVPWHYAAVWIGITTPLAYVALILGGLGWFLLRLARARLAYLREQPLDFVMMLAWGAPVAAVVVLHSTLYDGWRHLFFIYPPLLYFGVLCLAGLLDAARSWRPWLRLAPAAALAGVLACVGHTAFVMVRDHPYQNVYFNRLAGRNLQEIKSRFELDYWGLSCRRGLEHIVAHDDSPEIPIWVNTHPVLFNAFLLPPKDRFRLRWVDKLEKARYFVSHYRFHPDEYPTTNEVFCVKVDGAKILVVQRLDRN
jgi:hypothetical protein